MCACASERRTERGTDLRASPKEKTANDFPGPPRTPGVLGEKGTVVKSKVFPLMKTHVGKC